MPNYSRNDVVLLRYPFTATSGAKIRPAVIVSGPHPSQDLFFVPLTSQFASLLPGEFLLNDWAAAGLHIPTAAKRGLYTAHQNLILKSVGQVSPADIYQLEMSIKLWLEFK
jgi:mRNA interferase MazF